MSFLISFMKGNLIWVWKGDCGTGKNPDLQPSALAFQEFAFPSILRQHQGPRVWLFIDTNTKAAVVMGWGTQKQKSHFPHLGLI